MFCDADDWMDDNCLETLAEAAVRENADRVVSCIRNVDSNGKTLKIQYFGPNPSKWTVVLHHGALYKRELIETYRLRMSNTPR